MTTTPEVPMPEFDWFSPNDCEDKAVWIEEAQRVARAYADARCEKLRAELVEVMNAETQARRERDALLNAAVSFLKADDAANNELMKPQQSRRCEVFKARFRARAHLAREVGFCETDAANERGDRRSITAQEVDHDLQKMTAERDALAARLQVIEAKARAVVDRWETPLWKDAPPTAGVIYALRDAIDAAGAQP